MSGPQGQTVSGTAPCRMGRVPLVLGNEGAEMGHWGAVHCGLSWQEELAAALLNQRHLLEEEKTMALDKVRAEVLHLEQQHQAALQELGNIHTAEMQRQQAEQQVLQERAM